MPTSSFVTCHASPVGRTATSKTSLATSIPINMLLTRHRSSTRTSDRPILAQPCGCGLHGPGNCSSSKGAVRDGLATGRSLGPRDGRPVTYFVPILIIPEDTTNIQGASDVTSWTPKLRAKWFREAARQNAVV